MIKRLMIAGLMLICLGLAAQEISAPYFQNYDSMTANQIPSQGWNGLVSGTGSGVLIINGAANSRSVPNFARIAATTGTAILVTPEVQNLGSTKAVFWARIAQAAPFPSMIVGVMSDNTDPDTFYPIQTISTLNQTYQQFEISFADYEDYGPYIAIKHGNLATAKNILIDDFALEIIATEPIFNVGPISKNFGRIGIGFSSPNQNFTVSNAGIGTLDLVSVSLTGEDSDQFIIHSQPATYPQSLGAGQSLNLSISFSPTSVGMKTASLVLIDNLSRTEHAVTLTGEGFIRPDGSTCTIPLNVTLPLTDYVADLTDDYGNDYAASWISPSSNYINGNEFVLQFTLPEESYLSGSIAGTTSRTGLFILSRAPEPGNPAPVLAKGEGINGGSFSSVPLPAGDYFAIISSTQTITPIPYTLNLSAVAAGASNLVVNPIQKDFGLTVLHTSSSQSFALLNTGSSGLQILSINLTGANASEYSLADLPASFPADIPFAQQISALVVFTPLSEGNKTAEMLIETNIGDPLSIPLSGYGFKQFEGGNGTAENPFQVHDATQLNELRQYLGAAHTNVSFIQTADIDLTGISWMPIGTQANAFFGDFDGNGFKIRNLTISLPTTDYIGLFGSTNTSVFTRIALENASVTGNLFTGIMAGQVISSTIDRCYTTGSVTGNNNVGGLCGQNNGSFFTGSFSRANVFGVNSIGGFLGTSSSTFNPAIVNCFASGNVSNTTTGSLIGGLIGAVFSGPVQNCYSIGAVNGIGTSVTLWGGLIGNSLIAISNSYYNTETSGRTDSNRGLPRTTDEMTFPHAVNTYIGWNFDTIWAPDLAGINGGYPYLRSFVNTVEAGEVTVIVPDNVVHVPEINESTAVVVALPNYSNLTNLTVIGFTGTGAADLVVSVGAGNWYGLVYFNSSWHTSTPAFIEGPGVLTFAGVEFSAKGDVIVVLSEDIDPTLPVELSSFDAVLTAELFVNLTWVSESETNHSGYNVFRNLENTLLTAIRLNPGLISEGNQTGTQTTYKYTDMEVEANATYYYWLESVDLDGSSSFYGPVSITLNNQDPGQETPQLPMVTELLNAFPNPFNPQTTIRYSIREAGEVKIAIYNLKGQMIRSFTNNHSQAGYFNVIWDGYDSHGNAVGSGMYLYRMSSSNYSATRKMLLSK